MTRSRTVTSRAFLVCGASALALVLGVGLRAAATWEPARVRSASIPLPPTIAVGGGEVLLEVALSDRGVITAIRPLRTTPPFTDLMTSSVRTWSFEPARQADAAVGGRSDNGAKPAASKVLIACVFRPPTLIGPTLGQAPADVGKATEDTPFPTVMKTPSYPPHALNGASTLLELHVEPDGSVSDTVVVNSAPPFDEPAVAAAREWRFRPAVVNGKPVAAMVYVVFGFPAPILGQ